jgi:hypothetical protein
MPAMNNAAVRAAESRGHAQEFLDHAAYLVANGAKEDSKAVQMYRDFAQRKAWQGAREDAGRVFVFKV